MVGTYLLPVPMGHGETESGLEPPEGHLSPPNSTRTGHSLGVPHCDITAHPPIMSCAHLL